MELVVFIADFALNSTIADFKSTEAFEVIISIEYFASLPNLF